MNQQAKLAVRVGLVLLAVGFGILLFWPEGSDGLRIYSSLPEREQLQPLPGSAVVTSERTMDMKIAMRLALEQADHKAGGFDVEYEPLDDTDAIGDSPAALVQANARRAAADDKTAVYIGDFTSGATQESLPILSLAKVPQISVSSTRVGLTQEDPQGDVNEPARYYPPPDDDSNGYRNFVRLIPNAAVHARALLAVMLKDGCKSAAMINDNSSYGEAAANNIRAENNDPKNRHRVRLRFNEPVGPYGRYRRLVTQAQRLEVNCFVYSGIRNPNTVQIFEAIANKLPRAKLYGANGVVAASFFDPEKGGLDEDVARRVKVMVPPYADNARFRRFVTAFKAANNDEDPDPYAVYAYEAMQLTLHAIAGTTEGKREEIVKELYEAKRENSVLGSYSITNTGDTTVEDYGVSKIVDGKLTTPPPRAPRLQRR